MVAVQKPMSSKRTSQAAVTGLVCCIVVLVMLFGSAVLDVAGETQRIRTAQKAASSTRVNVEEEETPLEKQADVPEAHDGECPFMSLSDLSESERFPKEGPRHMVAPPADGKMTLVCCQTTQGPWNIAVHHNWAPLGAQRFLEMVRTGYFSTQIPLMRCIKEFLCQFGLSVDATLTKKWDANLVDDPQWLPPGPTNRENAKGVKRFTKGYLAYAGGGPNTRSNQFFVALTNVPTLAGGSPWEVPWGELVGAHSYEALDKVYTGYDDNGPAQGRFRQEGALEEVREKFPKLDWVTSCTIVDESQ